MYFPKYLILLATLALHTVSGEALAQRAVSTNQYDCNGFMATDGELGEMAIGVCNLDSVHELLYQQGSAFQGVFGFDIRSCWSWWSVNDCKTQDGSQTFGRYTVEVSGTTDSGSLVLTGSNGDLLPVELTFSHPSAGAESLSPDTESNTSFPGAPDMQLTPVEFSVSLPTQTAVVPGSYSGTFHFSLYQCVWWAPTPCKEAGSNGGAPALLSPPVPFTITLTVPTQIRISNLQDMVLSADFGGDGDIEDTRTFCVHTTGEVQFNLRADSLHGNGEFLLRGNSGIDSVHYQISMLKNTPPTGPEIQLQEGNTHTISQWRGHPRDGCNGGAENNMRVRVSIPQSELSGLADSSYTDTVTLTVEPE